MSESQEPLISLESSLGASFIGGKYDQNRVLEIGNATRLPQIVLHHQLIRQKPEEFQYKYKFLPFGYRTVEVKDHPTLSNKGRDWGSHIVLIGLFGENTKHSPLEPAYLPLLSPSNIAAAQWGMLCGVMLAAQSFTFRYQEMSPSLYTKFSKKTVFCGFGETGTDLLINHLDAIRVSMIGPSNSRRKPFGPQKCHFIPLVATSEPALSFYQHQSCVIFFQCVMRYFFEIDINPLSPISIVDEEQTRFDKIVFSKIDDSGLREWFIKYCDALLTAKTSSARIIANAFVRHAQDLL